MKTVLVTGFEPFGGDAVNPSALAAQALDGKVIAVHRVVGAVLPCVFGKSLLMLLRELRRLKPELVLCVGLAGGRSGISVERVAINIEDAIIPDNAGKQPLDRQVARSGPVAYWSTLPIKAVVSALREAGLEAWVSQSAGTFVCNYLFYGLMRTLAKTPTVRGGFIHVPYLPEQIENSLPSMRLEEIVRGLQIAIETSLATDRDLRAIGGATH